MRTLCIMLACGLAMGSLRAQEPTSAMDRLWADLSARDDAKSIRAALKLASTPAETTAFLAKTLKPVQMDEARFKALVKQLDSDDFDQRDTAYSELEYQGKTIREKLKAITDGKPSPEVRNQINRLIDSSYNDDPLAPPKANPMGVGGGSISISSVGGRRVIKIDGVEIDTTPKLFEKPGPQPMWVRASRAAAVLEHIGTPEARALLKKMAEGEADAMPTKAAREALERLK